MRSRIIVVVVAVATVLVLVTGCSRGGTSAAPADPNAPEVVEPGDIPDDQVFITYTPPGGPFTVQVPEGWARREAGDGVTFSDKYNSVRIESAAAGTPVSADAMRSDGLADVMSDPTFHLDDVAMVTRHAGTAALATYEIASPPNEVTGRPALLSVERYLFSTGSTTVVLTLSGAKGADNVDPWRTVTDSLTWT